MKKLNWKIILVVVIIIIVISLIIWYYNKYKATNISTDSSGRFVVKCVPDCADDEVCVKGACVKKKINYTL